MCSIDQFKIPGWRGTGCPSTLSILRTTHQGPFLKRRPSQLPEEWSAASPGFWVKPAGRVPRGVVRIRWRAGKRKGGEWVGVSGRVEGRRKEREEQSRKEGEEEGERLYDGSDASEPPANV